MHGIMQAGIGAVRGEERGNARDHAGWDGSREGRGERSCRGSGMSDAMQGIMQAGMVIVRREVMYSIMQAGMEAVRGEERGHARDHAGWDRSSEGRGERSCTVSCRVGLKR